MSNPEKKYTLDDGTVMTVKKLCQKTGMSDCCARDRLRSSTNPDDVFRPPGIPKKLYTLSNGDVFTIEQIMRITGCSDSTIRSRVYKTLAYDYVLCPLNPTKEQRIARNAARIRAEPDVDLAGTFRLSDGRLCTVHEVSKWNNISTRSAYRRLEKSRDPEKVFTPEDRAEVNRQEVINKFIAGKL